MRSMAVQQGHSCGALTPISGTSNSFGQTGRPMGDTPTGRQLHFQSLAQVKIACHACEPSHPSHPKKWVKSIADHCQHPRELLFAPILSTLFHVTQHMWPFCNCVELMSLSAQCSTLILAAIQPGPSQRCAFECLKHPKDTCTLWPSFSSLSHKLFSSHLQLWPEGPHCICCHKGMHLPSSLGWKAQESAGHDQGALQ